MSSVTFFANDTKTVKELHAKQLIVETLSSSCCCVYGLEAQMQLELRSKEGFLGCLEVSDSISTDILSRLVPVLYPALSEHLVEYTASEADRVTIDSSREPQRDKEPYIKYLNGSKGCERYGGKGHMKAVVLAKVNFPNFDVVWLPLEKCGVKYSTQVYNDDVFKRVAAAIHLFHQQLQPSQKGYLADEITAWLSSCKKPGAQAHSVYAVVVKDPLVKKMRVYVGQMGKNALYDRWRRSNISGALTSHIVCISQVIRKLSGTEKTASKIDSISKFQYDDLVMSSCIAEQLELGNLSDNPVNQTKCWVFPIEWVNSPDILDEREAHWTVILGGFDSVEGLNQEMTRKCRKHVQRCQECCSIWITAAKTGEQFYKDFSHDIARLWPQAN